MFSRAAFVGVAAAAVLGVVCASGRFAGKTKQDIQPDSSPGEKATLVYAGAKIPVTVEYQKNGSEVKMEFKAEGTVLETERYESTAESFAVAEAAGETLNPPLPILKFPFHLGDHYQWKGTLTFGGDRSATAEITTSESTVPMDGKTVPAILSTAKVSIDGGGEKPAIRELKFWIVAKRGVMMREIGQGVRRQPQ